MHFKFVEKQWCHNVSVGFFRDFITLAVLKLRESGDLTKMENRWWYDLGECDKDSSKKMVSVTFSFLTYPQFWIIGEDILQSGCDYNILPHGFTLSFANLIEIKLTFSVDIIGNPLLTFLLYDCFTFKLSSTTALTALTSRVLCSSVWYDERPQAVERGRYFLHPGWRAGAWPHGSSGGIPAQVQGWVETTQGEHQMEPRLWGSVTENTNPKY